MRILLLTDDHRSSVATVTANLSDMYRRKGHEIFVLTSHRTEESREIIREGDVSSLPVSYRISLRHWLSLYQPHVSRMLRQEMDHIRPDVIHAHNVHTYLTYDSLRVAKTVTSKVFITLHDVMSFAYGRLKSDRYLESNGKDMKLTMFDHMHTIGLQYNPFRNNRIRHALRNATQVFAVSNALRTALEANGIHGADVVWNGVETERWRVGDHARESMRERLRLQGRSVILFGGRLSADKGAHALLRALTVLRKRRPGVLLLVLGEEKRWNALVASSDMHENLSAHIRCTGWIDHASMPDLYAAADIVTVPSLCLDCLPSTTLEAMAAGKPVVGTIFGGIVEEVEEGVTGLLVDPRDTEKYAQAMETVLQQHMGERMGNAGRKRAEAFFTLGKQAETYLRYYGSS